MPNWIKEFKSKDTGLKIVKIKRSVWFKPQKVVLKSKSLFKNEAFQKTFEPTYVVDYNKDMSLFMSNMTMVIYSMFLLWANAVKYSPKDQKEHMIAYSVCLAQASRDFCKAFPNLENVHIEAIFHAIGRIGSYLPEEALDHPIANQWYKEGLKSSSENKDNPQNQNVDVFKPNFDSLDESSVSIFSNPSIGLN